MITIRDSEKMQQTRRDSKLKQKVPDVNTPLLLNLLSIVALLLRRSHYHGSLLIIALLLRGTITCAKITKKLKKTFRNKNNKTSHMSNTSEYQNLIPAITFFRTLLFWKKAYNPHIQKHPILLTFRNNNNKTCIWKTHEHLSIYLITIVSNPCLAEEGSQMVVECILEMVMGILELEEEEDKLVVGGEEEEEYLASLSKSLPHGWF